jgi:hypothetical protein
MMPSCLYAWDFDEAPTPGNKTLRMHRMTRYKHDARWRLIIRSVCGLPPRRWCSGRQSLGRARGANMGGASRAVTFPCRLEITLGVNRRRPGRRYGQDTVNRYAAVKPVEDAFVFWGWLRDDDDAALGGFAELVVASAAIDVPMRIVWRPMSGEKVEEQTNDANSTTPDVL